MTKLNDEVEWPKIYLRHRAARSQENLEELTGAWMTVMFNEYHGAWPREMASNTGRPKWRWVAWSRYGSVPCLYTQPEDQLPYAEGLKYLQRWAFADNAEDVLPRWFVKQLREVV